MFSLRLLMSSSKKPRPYCILAQQPPTRPPPPDAGGSIVAFLLGLEPPLMRRNGRFGGLGLVWFLLLLASFGMAPSTTAGQRCDRRWCEEGSERGRWEGGSKQPPPLYFLREMVWSRPIYYTAEGLW
jgi:hypothetical protein